jgi:hypothetical protein
MDIKLNKPKFSKPQIEILKKTFQNIKNLITFFFAIIEIFLSIKTSF